MFWSNTLVKCIYRLSFDMFRVLYGWMDGWIGRWMERGVDGWMDGWIMVILTISNLLDSKKIYI